MYDYTILEGSLEDKEKEARRTSGRLGAFGLPGPSSLERAEQLPAPQEKLHKLKSVTSTSYYDFDIDFEIPFYGTHDLEEYLVWECNMDNYLKILQVPYEVN
ncbi:gag-pol polyprotein [Hordeum vulgare]|nr:gag-pol polyprotein [Hordeum vulgare]